MSLLYKTYSLILIKHQTFFVCTCTYTWITIYLYAWRRICLCSWRLVHSHALMILLKCKGDWTVRCICTRMLKCSCTCMFTCFVDHMLKWLLSLMITCSYVYLLWWSYVLMFTCFDVTCSYIYMLQWSYPPISTCLDDHMLLRLHALTITCPHELISAWAFKNPSAHTSYCPITFAF